MATAEEIRANAFRQHIAAQGAARLARERALVGSTVAYKAALDRAWPRVYDMSAGAVATAPTSGLTWAQLSGAWSTLAAIWGGL